MANVIHPAFPPRNPLERVRAGDPAADAESAVAQVIAQYRARAMGSPTAVEAATDMLEHKVHAYFGRLLLEVLVLLGEKDALPNLATSLMLGDGGPPQQERANRLLEQTLAIAERPEARAYAASMLGDSYRDGRGVNRDVAASLKYYRVAMDNGGVAGAYNLGIAYEGKDSIGLPVPDYAAAAECYARVADVDLKSKTNLGRLHMLQLFPGANPSQGKEMLRQAAKDGDAIAGDLLRNLAPDTRGQAPDVRP